MHTIWNGQVVSCSWLADQKRRKLRELLEGVSPTGVQPRTRTIGLSV